MLSKIFIKNFSAHKNNYIVYIASSASAVMVYFILFFLTNNPMLSSEVAGWKNNLQRITASMGVILLIFEWVFVAYVSGMFIKDRKKEFNLYKFLGISKYRIATGVFFETIFIQTISWVIGFLLAIVLSKFFGMLLIKVMNLAVDYTFFLNFEILKAVGMTFLSFTLLLALVNFIRAIRLKDKFKKSRNWRILRYILGIIGAAMTISGCYIAIRFTGILSNFNAEIVTANEQKLFLEIPLIIFSLVAVGTYFLYVGFLEIVINFLSKSSTIKYNGLKNITGKLFDKSLRKNVSSLWIITIISGLSILMLFVAVILLQSTKYYDDSIYPYDMAINQDYIKEAKQVLVENKSEMKSERKLTTKQVMGVYDNDYYSNNDIISVISYSDYERTITPEQKKYNDEINANQTMLLSDSGGIMLDVPRRKQVTNFTFLDNNKKVKITHHGKSLPISPRLFYGDVLVVPQKLYNEISNKHKQTLYGLNYSDAHSDKLNGALKKLATRISKKSLAIYRSEDRKNKDRLLMIDVTSSQAGKAVDKVDENEERYGMQIDKETYKISDISSSANKQTRGFVIFIISILSVIFVVALESILSIKQFSENVRNRQMYQTIRDLGIGQNNINKLVFRQTALLFYLPMMLATFYAIVGANFFIKISFNDYWYMFFMIIVLYVFFYSILFFITERIAKAQVNKMIN